MNPQRAKNMKDFRGIMADWVKKVKDYEVRYEEVQDSVKLAALKACIPLDLHESRFRGTKYVNCKSLKQGTYASRRNSSLPK